ncbi:hypothetical protein C8J95_11266 [Elizabethkingia sp. YR214]|uniref:hypothetical protein n=1 Tax=Elizabethkingia sp. YR214 TaxID=2135667 RepID=UPI000D4DD402|nr:hypothetical protein [Elizabethkingia sp. YR214]PUB25899.1 hypothetical protein C8J95_11266 [Elizabethkingia sp. YR214]
MKKPLLLFICLISFTIRAASQTPEQRTASETIRSFVKWYGENWEKLSRLESNAINTGISDPKEKTIPSLYSINFREVEKYIAELSSTCFFSEEYLEVQRQQFEDADTYFKENPQYEGPPEGFQYDRFFLTQEDFFEDIKNIDNIRITEKLLKNNATNVRMYLSHCNMTYSYLLSMQKGEWQIDSITVYSIPYG